MNGGPDTRDGGGRRAVRALEPGKVLSGVILIVGLAVIAFGTYGYLQDSTTLDKRVEVTAEITDTGVERVDALRGGERYVATVTFEYRFRGTAYTSDNIFPGQSPPRDRTVATAESRLSAFPVGETVTAYVDPAAPDQAFLEDGRSGQPTRYLAFGLLLAVVGGLRLLQVWRRPSGRDAALMRSE